jgi:protein-tyrosine kinase
MSRINEALQRRAGGSPLPAPGPGPDAYRSPWTFPDGRSQDARAQEALPDSPPERHDELALVDGPTAGEPSFAGGVVSGFNSQWKERLVISPDANPFLVEQFRRLAATLHQAQSTNNLRTVMVTSAQPGDGKTLTAINLALILSESYGRRVLLIDADLRRPSIRDVSNLPNVVGLADGLRARTEQKLTTFRLTPHLSLLPAGRPDPDPMAGLTSPRMRHVIADAAAHFEWVIVDAPPVGIVADGSILADMVDGTLLVIRARQTDAGITQKAIDAVGRERILGVVLNGIKDLDPASHRYYGYGYGEGKGSVGLART